MFVVTDVLCVQSVLLGSSRFGVLMFFHLSASVQ